VEALTVVSSYICRWDRKNRKDTICTPVFDHVRDWVLRCPQCGHIDPLTWMPERARKKTLKKARCRWRLRKVLAATAPIASNHNERRVS
jgi:hypothetical protein